MQQLFYDQAAYHIFYYDNELHAYHTDKFANWQTQPTDGGTPFFVNGYLNYTLLTDAKATPSPSPSQVAPSVAPSPSAGASAAPSAAPSPAPSATPAPGGGDTGGGSNTLLLVGGAVVLVAILAVGFVAWRRRSATSGPGGEEE
jgi:LPXTG-motif cell wall-anchored protein